KFGRILASDDALVAVDIVRQAIQQSRLAGTGPARNDDIAAHTTDDFQHFGAMRRDGTELHQLVERQLVLPELADCKGSAIDGKRWGDDVDARAVGKARIAYGGGFIDAAPDLADDALTHIEQLLIVAKADACLLDLAVDFDEDALCAIDHDI